MAGPAARLLALLSLLQTGRAWPGPELADRLEVTGRTVRRDVERLRDLGYPIDATIGAIGGYRLVAGAAMPPLLLDDEEAIAIAIGLRTAASNPVAGIEDASLRALAKLEQVLPTRLRERVSTLGAALLPFPGYGAPPPPAVDPETLTVIARTIADRARLRFRYQSFDRAETRRTVEPERLVANGRAWYLVAWDVDRDDWRIFRVDRIEDPWSVPGRFVRHDLPASDAAAYVAARLGEMAPTYRAVATLHASIETIRRLVGEGIGRLEPLDEQRCRVTIETDTLDWLAFRLTALGFEFKVHEPPELIAHLHDLRGRIERAVAAGGGRLG